MKKFIITKEHPIFKEGIELLNNGTDYYIYIEGSNGNVCMQEIIINEWLKNGYIKEGEEKEFTKSDMVDLLRFCDENRPGGSYADVFNNWLK